MQGQAEREGFEPSEDLGPSPVFETGPFDRSGTSPILYNYGTKPLCLNPVYFLFDTPCGTRQTLGVKATPVGGSSEGVWQHLIS